MPEIDALLGLSFKMYFYDTQRHSKPHIHIQYGSFELVMAIKDGECLEGYLPNKQRKRAEQHTALHRVELLMMWEMAVMGVNPGKLREYIR